MTEYSVSVSSWQRQLNRFPSVAFVGPLLIFLLIGSLEVADRSQTACFGLIHHEHYPVVYCCKILLTTLALVACWPAYRTIPIKINPLAAGVGVIGVAVWVGLVQLRLERFLPLDWLTQQGQRAAYNPLEALGQRPLLAYAFLAVRFFGLAVVIAIAEEMFLRGFVIRWVEAPDDWNTLPIGNAGWPALIAGTAVPALMHPAELLAALAWFSLVTWLMLRTKNLWDCIVAHMVTNLLLGIYVLTFQQWHFW